MIEMTDYEEQWRYATRLRLAAWETGDPVLFRQAAAEYRELGRDEAADACDERAKYYERKEDV